MSIRHLDAFFAPATVAVFGASDNRARVGGRVWRNLRREAFAGKLWPVNPHHRYIGSVRAYASAIDLPEAPDLAVICTPPATVPDIVRDLARRGTRAAVVLTAGLDAAQRQAMLEAARPALLRIIGPNGLGLLSPGNALNASFAHTGATPGRLAFVSQSGALVTAMLDWARERSVGFSRFVSLGDHADVDFGDMLDWLATDADTRAILLYVESISAPRKFMSAARAAARNKPVIVVKAGRSPGGQRAAASHTGALAASDLVFDAAIRRAGMLRVDTLQQLFTAAQALSSFRGAAQAPRGSDAERLARLTLLTNGGGAGVMAADAADFMEVDLAPLPAGVREVLNGQLPPNWSRDNPVDIVGDAPAARYELALRALLADRDCGTVLLMHAPTALVRAGEIAKALLPLAQAEPQRVISCWMGGPAVQPARQLFSEAGLATYDTPEEAVRAFAMVVNYRRNQEQLMEAPPALAPARIDTRRIRQIVDHALAAGRTALAEPEAQALLTAGGIPVVASRVVGRSPAAAARAAAELGFPVALKILSPQLSHKSDVGGVALSLGDEAAVQRAARAMLRRIRREQPQAEIHGFTVQVMVQRPQARELIVGTSIDPLFGPVVMFGQGGTSVEVVADRAVALPPLNPPLARALIARTRVARLLQGWRDVPAVDEEALHGVLVQVSQLLTAVPEIAELDINPLLADAQGVLALDARVRLDPSGPAGAAHFAIRPYPEELCEAVQWHDRRVTLRPIRPEDEQQHRAFLERLEPADVRMRIFYSRRSFERSELARLTQIDYEREMAFIATAPGPGGVEETLGVVRATTDPDNQDAEFGLIVRSDLKRGGLGRILMHKLINYLKSRGTKRLVATVLNENLGMLSLAQRLGFQPLAGEHEDGTQAIALPLQG